jgi:prepilin-type N-terminal cleavage/methylation domain-containing protein
MRIRLHSHASSARRHQFGYTLLEALVVVTIIGILAAAGIPSFIQSMNSATVTSQVSAFTSAVRSARAEAIRRGRMVTLCRSDNPEAANPTCTNTAGGATGWASGWIVFEDSDPGGNRGVVDANDSIISVQAPFNNSGGFIDQGVGGYILSFQPSGMPFGLAGGTFNVYPNDADKTTRKLMAVQVVIANTGRTSVGKIKP